MIALLRGKVVSKEPNHVILDVNGVGYRVFISLQTYHDLPNSDEATDLFIYTAVREDAIHLYGFLSSRDKQVFERLIGVSGIGAKQAMNILSGINADDLINAICTGDAVCLTSISGIGKKTADRMILELKDKVLDLASTMSTKAAVGEKEPMGGIEKDVMDALINLGYDRSVSRKAMSEALKKLGPKAELGEVIKESLRIAAKV